MYEEIYSVYVNAGLPLWLQRGSASLVNRRKRRTTFICVIIIIMSAVSSTGLFACHMAINNQRSVETELPTDSIQAFLPKSTSINDLSTNVTNKSITNLGKNWIKQQPNDFDVIRAFYKRTKNDSSVSFIRLARESSSRLKSRLIRSAAFEKTEAQLSDPCSHPEYMVFTWVLNLIALATGLRLYYLVKTFLAFVMVFTKATLILAAYPEVFHYGTYNVDELGMPLAIQMVILLVIFFIMVTYHARLVEVTSRLDFIWKEQAEKELANMKSNRYLNDVLIKVRVFKVNLSAIIKCQNKI